jgi:3-hydroxyisobutyrate dehydrogenase-like beta-hydroxyacid dehydrogenase
MGKTLGFIGLGNMGRPMAANLTAVCDQLLVLDHHEENMEALCVRGAVRARDYAEIAEKAEVIFLSLPDGSCSREAVAGENGLLARGHRGQYILDTSTVDIATSRDLHKAAEGRGIIYLDAPVSGGVKKAADGTLTFMVGASEEELKPILPYVKALSGTIHYMGKIGSGTAIKIINNYMSFATQIVNAEALVMADEMKISFDDFYQVVSTSSGGNTGLSSKKDKIRSQDLSASFTVDLAVKDLELAAQICREARIPNFTLNNAIQWFRLAQNNGFSKDDVTSVIYLIRSLTRHDAG